MVMAEIGTEKYRDDEEKSRVISIRPIVEAAPHPEETINFAPCREKHQLLHANEPNRRRRALIT